MMRKGYLRDLAELNSILLEMGSYVESAIESTLHALKNGDAVMAEQVVLNDVKVNECERRVESLCFKLLLTQQPVASDLRMVSAALKMITDLERIGDFATDIAEIIKASPSESQLPDFMEKMFAVAKEMVFDSVLAYTNQDVALAKRVCATDDEVDNYFVETKKYLLNEILNNGSFADRALDLMMVAKYIERIGDHSTNVAEWVIFGLTGEHKGGFKPM